MAVQNAVYFGLLENKIMRLSWNEIRSRASKFSKEWESAHYEKGETQSFYNDLFEVFGVSRRRVAVFERQVRKIDTTKGYIDLFWPGVLLVEQKSAGRDLQIAKMQAEEYCLGLKPVEFPRYLLLSDFQTFELYDLEEGEETKFSLNEFPKYVEKLGFIIGVQKRTFHDQDPVNIVASELMGRVHDALRDSGYVGHDLEEFLVRLLFCLFSDDTGIFEPRGIFENLINDRTADDGADLGQWISQLFDVLNTPENNRYSTLDEDLAAFPYINGELFARRLPIPSFTREIRLTLIRACEFSWDAISPAIFGALFQSVMDKEMRRQMGAHYTTEKNIMKVIEPLFLQSLRNEFEQLKSRKTNRLKLLTSFQEKLSRLTFFDPACGCGNFLVIAYREIRQLELDVLIAMRQNEQLMLNASLLSMVDVNQFFGIEIGELPCRIAEVAMWMMDHIMNNKLSLEFGLTFIRIPLNNSPHIINADALEVEWNEVLNPNDCNYVFGNPPFIGSKYQSKEQRRQVSLIAALGKSGGTLDYVCAWFIKAGAYILNSSARIAFVSTNSITQGEQVSQLWPILFNRHNLEIMFAHRTFAWGSDAKGKAHVHVIILGLSNSSDAPTNRRLFFYEKTNEDAHEIILTAISPYLINASHLANPYLVVSEKSRPINGLPNLISGSKPIDGGHYIFTDLEKGAFLELEPNAEKFIHPYIGSREFLNGGTRWILALQNASPAELNNLQLVRDKIAKVRNYRITRESKPTQELAKTPTAYHINVIPTNPFLVVPKVSSERREYLPIGWLEPPTIPSDLVFVLTGAKLWQFGLLTSAMHMSWLRCIGGRLESRYRYSIGLVYNNFPLPEFTKKQEQRIEMLSQSVLVERANYPDSTLAELYDPDLMPNNLRIAHRALDLAVDKLYRKTPFKSESERVEYLFGLYENMIVA